MLEKFLVSSSLLRIVILIIIIWLKKYSILYLLRQIEDWRLVSSYSCWIKKSRKLQKLFIPISFASFYFKKLQETFISLKWNQFFRKEYRFGWLSLYSCHFKFSEFVPRGDFGCVQEFMGFSWSAFIAASC